jgi:hypothetical protein
MQTPLRLSRSGVRAITICYLLAGGGVVGFESVDLSLEVDLSVDFAGAVVLPLFDLSVEGAGFAGAVLVVSVFESLAGGVSARTGAENMARARAALSIVFI